MKFDPKPTLEELATSLFTSWLSEDEQWKVTRVTNRFNGEPHRYAALHRCPDGRYEVIGRDPLGPGYPKYHNTLTQALNSIEETSGQRIKNRVEIQEPLLQTRKGITKMATTPIVVEKKMKISRETAIALLKAVGIKADLSKYDNKELGKKIRGLPGQELDDVPDGELSNVLDDVLSTLEDGGGVFVKTGTDDEEESPAPKKKSSEKDGGREKEVTTKTKDKAAAKGRAKDKAAAKGDGASSGRQFSKPGVVSTIVECLTKASQKSPITADEIHKILVKKFPDRAPDSMRSTIRTQLHWMLPKEKGVKLGKSDDGFWMPKSELSKLERKKAAK